MSAASNGDLRRRWRRNLREAGRNIRANRVTSLGVLVAVTMAFYVSTVGAVLWQETRSSAARWRDGAGVSVYLCTDGSLNANCNGRPQESRVRTIEQELLAHPGVQRVERETSQEAYEQFTRRLGLGDRAGYVDEMTLPDSFRVDVVDTGRADLVTSVGAWQDVDMVVDQRQNLDGFFSVVSAVTMLLGFAAASQTMLATMMLTGMIRASVRRKRNEIRVMDLVGADTKRIRGPFTVESVLLALVGISVGVGAGVGTVHGTDLLARLLTVAPAARTSLMVSAAIGLSGVLLSWALSRLTVRSELSVWDRERSRRG